MTVPQPDPPSDPWSAPPPGYGTPYAAAPPTRPANGFGTAALVLGIIGLLLSVIVIGGLIGLVAIVFGVLGWRRVRRGVATNRGAAITGLGCGLVAVVASVLVVWFVISTFGDSVRRYQRCLERAGADSVAQQVCTAEFRRDLESDVR